MVHKSEKIDFTTVLASCVHDMKNSITMLLGSISEIDSEGQSISATSREKLHRIQHEGHRVNRDLVQLLTLYKLDRELYHVNINEVNIYEFFDEIILEMQSLLKGRGIVITQKCDKSLFGFFDVELVASAIKTIVNNAYQYTNDKILLGGKFKDGFLILSVSDNGNGYPDQLLSNQATVKVETNISTGSTGLGLYFSSRIAELHTNKNKAGYIQIKNNTSKNELTGGCFSMFLP